MATKPEEAFYESLGIGRPSPQGIVDYNKKINLRVY
jgi:hypothetical protein